MTAEEKQAELIKFRDLNLATINYYDVLYKGSLLSENTELKMHRNNLKVLVEEHFQKGRLTILRRWFQNLTEMFQLEGGVAFSKYIKEKTGYEIDILKDFHSRINKILSKGKITTDTQYRDAMELLNDLPQAEQFTADKRERLNHLLLEYERRKRK